MDIPTDSEILASIDRFLDRHGMAPTRFGSLATGEAQLLKSIRDGRSPSLKLLQRVKSFMERYDAEQAALSSGSPDDLSRAAPVDAAQPDRGAAA